MAAREETFEYRSVIRTTMEAILQFHQEPRALPLLTPPPLFVQIVRDDRVSLTEGEIEFKIWFGPCRFTGSRGTNPAQRRLPSLIG